MSGPEAPWASIPVSLSGWLSLVEHGTHRGRTSGAVRRDPGAGGSNPPPDTMEVINALAVMTFSSMAADPLTTIPVRESTRAELQRLKSGGQSYDEVIRAILEELEERDPWFAEMEQRVADWKQSKIKLEPIETLWDKDKKTRARKSR